MDANGNQLTQVERRTAVGGTSAGAYETTEYGYDALDRLVGVKYPDGTARLYQLDKVGNRTGERKTLAAKVAALTVAAFAAVQPADAGERVGRGPRVLVEDQEPVGDVPAVEHTLVQGQALQAW